MLVAACFRSVYFRFFPLSISAPKIAITWNAGRNLICLFLSIYPWPKVGCNFVKCIFRDWFRADLFCTYEKKELLVTNHFGFWCMNEWKISRKNQTGRGKNALFCYNVWAWEREMHFVAHARTHVKFGVSANCKVKVVNLTPCIVSKLMQ